MWVFWEELEALGLLRVLGMMGVLGLLGVQWRTKALLREDVLRPGVKMPLARRVVRGWIVVGLRVVMRLVRIRPRLARRRAMAKRRA
jgi:hypothetical protein